MRLRNAMMSMRMNQFLGERFQTAPGGDDLEEDVHAIAVFVDHSFDGVELTANFANPDN